jgi:DnaJ-class molecular chaperone
VASVVSVPKKRDPWQILGIPRGSTPEQIKIAYRQKARDLHPDRNKGSAAKTEQFKDVAWAYEVLTDPKRKVEFDANATQAFDNIVETLFGHGGGDLAERVRSEGIGAHNIDSLIMSFFNSAQEIHKDMPDRVAAYVKNTKPSDIAALFEKSFLGKK